MAYTTAALAQAEIKGVNVSPTELLRLADQVSRRVKREFKIDFEPYYRTKKITPTSMIVNQQDGLLDIKDYLLETTTLTNSGNALTLGTNYFYNPQGVFPVKTLRLASPWSDSWYPVLSVSNASRFDTIVLTGWFGYRENYDTEGWLDTTNTIATIGGIAATSALTTFTVQDADGQNIMGDAPAFSPGNLLRIDNEMMEVQAVDATAEVVTVRRAQNGSPAAAHSQGATILYWNQSEDIVRVINRQVASLFARKGAFNTLDVSGIGVTAYPADLLDELRGALQGYANV